MGKHDEVLKRLITAGASVNCRNGYGDVCSGNPRFTALSFAVKHHRESAVRLMLPHIDENALDSVDRQTTRLSNPTRAQELPNRLILAHT